MLRTFSKVYGLCGLRVGYALGSEEFRVAVDRVRQPFSVNGLAQAAATEAVHHLDELERRVERTAIERMHVETALEERGLEHRQAGELLLGVAGRSRRGRRDGRAGEARRDSPRREGARRARDGCG